MGEENRNLTKLNADEKLIVDISKNSVSILNGNSQAIDVYRTLVYICHWRKYALKGIWLVLVYHMQVKFSYVLQDNVS